MYSIRRDDQNLENTKKKPYVIVLGIYFAALVLGAATIGTLGSGLRLLGILPAIIWILDSRKIGRNKFVGSVLLYTMWALCTYIWSIDSSATLKYWLSLFTFLLLIITTSGYKYTNDEIVYLRKCLVWASRITAVITLVSSGYYEGRLTLTGFIHEDPNYLCGYFLFAIIDIVSALSSENRSIKYKVLRSLELFMYLYIVVATGSRGGAIAISVSVIVSFIMYQARLRPSIRTFIGRIFALILVIFLFEFLTHAVSTDILDRFQISEIVRGRGTGRISIWEDTINAFNHSSILRQFIGYGAGTSYDVAQLFDFRRQNVTHNAFLAHLIEQGILGLVFYCNYIFGFLFASKRQNNIFAFSCMIGFITLSLSTTLGAFKPYWNIMIFILCLYNLDSEQDIFQTID